ncbi:MAG: long-chain fatty acid--CoA ligase [Nitrospiraceae bacterium]|nr:MAG: long-chain fatty acid--CoA ligase [Nitrospiraceae bacterium]
MNIFETIKQETDGFADKIAIIEGDRNITYRQLILSSEAVASSLKEKGVSPFHRVGLLCSDSIDYITVSLAVLSLSAVIVPVATEHTETEVNNILDSIMVDFLVFEKDAYDCNDACIMQSTGISGREFYFKDRENKRRPDSEYYKLNPAFIRFSSGTTGESKGVVLSHESIIERTDAADKGLNITHNDTVLWVLSMSFHFVVTILLFLRRAATIVLCSSPFPEALIEGITKHKGTFIYASPFHYNLLTHMDSLSPGSFQNIRLAISTAMKLPENIADGFNSKFGLELSEAYGVIEAGLPFINLSPDKNRRSSVGRALPDYEVGVVNKDEDGVGLIHIRGKGMLDAYFSPWQGRNSILKDGWFNTGDLGKIDEDGFLTITGRGKDVINFAGMKVFPYEVEAVINQFPGVKASLVYGEPHPGYGQLPMAKIVPRDGVDRSSLPDSLRKYCYRKLAQYKVPKGFEIVNEIRRTPSGKIKR